MAPKKGGGGGGGGSGGSISINNRCSEVDAFYSSLAQATVALNGICLLFFFILSYVWLVKRKRVPHVVTLLPGWTFGLSLLLQILSYISFIVVYCLSECYIIYYNEYYKLVLISVWFDNIGQLLFFAVIIFTVIPHMWSLVGSKTFLPKVVNGVVYGLWAIMLITWLGLITYNNTTLRSYVYYIEEHNTVDAQIKISVAEAVISMLLSISIIALMAIPLSKMKSVGIAPGSLTAHVAVFAFVLFGWRLIRVVERVYFNLQAHSTTVTGAIVESVFIYVFTSLPWMCLLFLVAAPAMGAQASAPPYDAVTGKGENTQYAHYAHDNGLTQNPAYQPVHNMQQQPYNPVQSQPQNQWGGYNPVPTQAVGTEQHRW